MLSHVDVDVNVDVNVIPEAAFGAYALDCAWNKVRSVSRQRMSHFGPDCQGVTSRHSRIRRPVGPECGYWRSCPAACS